MRYFVMHNNPVTLGLQKHVLLIKHIYVIFSYVPATYGKYVTITLRLGLSIYCVFSYVKIMFKCFSYNDIFFMTLGLHSFVVCCITYGNNVWKLRFVFVRHCNIFLISLQLHCLYVRYNYVYQ